MFWKKKPTITATQVSDDTWQEMVVESKVPVLVDFYADWCGPCKILGPIIDELAAEYKDKALVVKVNTESNPKLSQHFKVKSIPMIMFINKGEVVEQYNGLIPKPNLAEILDDYIKENA